MNQYLIIQIIALFGLFDSLYIYYKKKKNKKLFCIIGEDCSKILNSRYSKTLGIPNEVGGVIYYLTIIILLLYPATQIILFLKIIAGMSLLFTLYLLFVQLAVLKEWCDYCLLASLINISIFVMLVL